MVNFPVEWRRRRRGSERAGSGEQALPSPGLFTTKVWCWWLSLQNPKRVDTGCKIVLTGPMIPTPAHKPSARAQFKINRHQQIAYTKKK